MPSPSPTFKKYKSSTFLSSSIKNISKPSYTEIPAPSACPFGSFWFGFIKIILCRGTHMVSSTRRCSNTQAMTLQGSNHGFQGHPILSGHLVPIEASIFALETIPKNPRYITWKRSLVLVFRDSSRIKGVPSRFAKVAPSHHLHPVCPPPVFV